MSSVTWGCCKLDPDSDEYEKCISCHHAFHLDCLHQTDLIELEANVNMAWKCPGCKQKKTRGIRSDDTPVGRTMTPASAKKHSNVTNRPSKRPALSTSLEVSPGAGPSRLPSLSSDEVRQIVADTIRAENKELTAQLSSSITAAFRSELKSIRNDVQDLKESLNFFSKEYEDLKKEHETNITRMKSLEDENGEMKSTISSLQSRLTQLEQRARLNNVEVQCIPENKHENLPNIVLQISKLIGCEFMNENISQVSRIAKVDRTNNRPRSVVVQFDNARNRDTFLASSIKFNKRNPADKLNTAHIGITGDKRPIFIVEHLSPTNKALHAAARIKAREMKYDFVWVRNGRIFVRKNEGADPIYIKDMDCLSKMI